MKMTFTTLVTSSDSIFISKFKFLMWKTCLMTSPEIILKCLRLAGKNSGIMRVGKAEKEKVFLVKSLKRSEPKKAARCEVRDWSGEKTV